ncbi:hypothetical protein [Paenibacillus sp. OAS669]|uniref:hypothetical protein n=1 Tax=Paenibacillus sp. OAS669 TaxID=2663821 RepID=UPI001789BB8B|nr:hypothetical protein [Paenibacillus sp. OAS669]MBE1443889.1 hypothetical protein [Paenibacillus sp. OAS669]
MNERLYAKCNRSAELFRLFERLTADYAPGEYRFAERYPAEHKEYRTIYTEFLASEDPALVRVGFRMKRFLLELDETDRTFKRNRQESRQARKQLDLLRRATRQLDEAIRTFILALPEEVA